MLVIAEVILSIIAIVGFIAVCQAIIFDGKALVGNIAVIAALDILVWALARYLAPTVRNAYDNMVLEF